MFVTVVAVVVRVPLVAAKAPPCCHVACCVLVSITHCRRVAGVSRLLHYHANVRSPQRRTHANNNGVVGRVRLLCPLASTHVDSSPRHKACARPRVAEERLSSRLRLGLWHGIGWCTSTRRRRASHLDVSASASGMALVWCTSTRRRKTSHLGPSPPLWSRRPSSRCGSVKKLLCRGSFRTLLLCTLITSQGQLMCAIKRSSLNRSPSSKLSLTVTVVVKRSQLPVPSQSQPSTQVVMPAPTHCGNPPSLAVKSASRASWSLPQQPSPCCRAPVSIHRTVSCSGVPTFTGPRHKWCSHRREFICPGPIREALLTCVLLVTSNCATSRNASSEHKLEQICARPPPVVNVTRRGTGTQHDSEGPLCCRN